MTVRPLIASATALTATVGIVAALAVSGSQAATTKIVKVEDFQFSPAKLTIKRNTTVKFVWKGKAEHDVSLLRKPRGVRMSPVISDAMARGSATQKFRTKGTYRIDCSIHANAMKLTVVVK
ncbi:plastocyanin/azurin family copper-binding protein [Patulibacter sp.]|uniref:plastocyanin/azurin family copper-binding protein n=1 Tax=Patulibacter sp. TaxID=1912859 RepID=UPI002717FC41|nr:plastocyanin/azurin family copper-binding protein [Patulibacter sp.]MDO9407345.1 cupredoxin domain-containing protein [Patulibacter sp.]